MSKKNKPLPDHVASQADQDARRREMEQKSQKSQLLRVEYVLGLLDLGLDEILCLEYQNAAIVPVIRLNQVDPETAAKQREELLKFKADMTQMGSGIITDPTA